ncbi:hypothetical protein B7760_06065 (plasmid) [Burkholderia glumae]|nr:hypothetical protein B7760_06065 [Burkholderia glumae]QKM57845.1 hypothetical protein CG017_05925 [Burkholderia glumae]
MCDRLLGEWGLGPTRVLGRRVHLDGKVGHCRPDRFFSRRRDRHRSQPERCFVSGEAGAWMSDIGTSQDGCG